MVEIMIIPFSSMPNVILPLFFKIVILPLYFEQHFSKKWHDFDIILTVFSHLFNNYAITNTSIKKFN